MTTTTFISKIIPRGTKGSFAIALPKAVLKELGWAVGTPVKVQVERIELAPQ